MIFILSKEKFQHKKFIAWSYFYSFGTCIDFLAPWSFNVGFLTCFPEEK